MIEYELYAHVICFVKWAHRKRIGTVSSMLNFQKWFWCSANDDLKCLWNYLHWLLSGITTHFQMCTWNASCDTWTANNLSIHCSCLSRWTMHSIVYDTENLASLPLSKYVLSHPLILMRLSLILDFRFQLHQVILYPILPEPLDMREFFILPLNFVCIVSVILFYCVTSTLAVQWNYEMEFFFSLK